MPAFFLASWIPCRRCGRSVEADDGGVPARKDHPYYGKFICDNCFDELEAEKEEIKMEAFVDRMIDEYDTLCIRIEKAKTYLSNPGAPPRGVDNNVKWNRNRGLLRAQIPIMIAYKELLEQRILLYVPNFKEVSEKEMDLSPLDFLAAEYDRKHPHGIRFVDCMEGADDDACKKV